MTDTQALKRLNQWQKRDRERWVNIELSTHCVLVHLYRGDDPVRRVGGVSGVSLANCVETLDERGVLK